MPIYHELKITDGTTVINLLNLPDGYSVEGHRQQIAQYKGGGTWSQSALGAGGQLVYYAYDDVIESYPISAVVTGAPEATTAALADLLALLRKCADYWVDEYKSEPVWIQAQASGEPGKRYAIIKTGALPDLGNPYEEPWITSSALASLELTVRRGHWQNVAPKLSTALAISSMQTFDGRNYGNVDSADVREPITTDGVFVNNQATETNLTHQYRYTNIGAVWSGNLQLVAVPYTLIGTAVGDTSYFGIRDTGAAQRTPFYNLVFDIGTAQTGLTIAWEYWNGAAFINIPAFSDTTAINPALMTSTWSLTGVNSVVFPGLNAWVVGNLFTLFGGAAPNFNAYWLRAHVTGVGGGLIAPIQQNRRVYVSSWTSLRVESDAVAGQLPAICKAIFHNRSEAGGAKSTDAETARIIGGIRSVDRGTTFRANLNLGGEQNPPISTLITPTATAARPEWMPLLVGSYAPGGVAAASVEAVINLLSNDYHGKFRVFVRYYQTTGAAGDVSAYLIQTHALGGGGHIKTSKTLSSETGPFRLWDFGEFNIPGILPMEEVAYNYFHLYLANSNAGGTNVRLYDIIFMPIDEFTFDVSEFDVGQLGLRWPYLGYIDSIIDPKRIVRTAGFYSLAGPGAELRSIWLSIAGDRLQLEPGKIQKLWLLCSDYETHERSYPGLVNSFQMESVTRYLSLREA